jgi:hypothetical protein
MGWLVKCQPYQGERKEMTVRIEVFEVKMRLITAVRRASSPMQLEMIGALLQPMSKQRGQS